MFLSWCSSHRWNCDPKIADNICCYNRHYAEHSGYFESKTSFLSDAKKEELPITFYDSVTGKPLFTAPVGRTLNEFLEVSLIQIGHQMA